MLTLRRLAVSPRTIEAALIAALTLGVLYPLWEPGYLLLLDLPFGPRPFPVWTFDGTPQHLAPLWLLCNALYHLVPAPEVVGKSLAVAVLVAIGAAAAPLGGTSRAGRLFAISLCMVNPWVSDRLAVGHIPLLASYAAAMVTLRMLIEVTQRPSRRAAVHLALGCAAVGMFSPHLLYVLALLSLVVGAARIARPGQASRRALIESGSIAAGLTVLLSAYWLVPLLAEPSLLGRFGEADVHAFITRGDAALGVPFNVAAFYGFWRRMPLTKDWLAGWWLLADLMLVLGAGGIMALWRQRSTRWLSVALLAAYTLVLAVACGTAFEPTSVAWRWAFEHVPGFRGLREPQKASAFLVIITAYAGARGLDWMRGSFGSDKRVALGALALALPLIAGAGEFGGVAGALAPVRYPAAWYSAAAFLRDHEDRGDAVLVLPWRQYSTFAFTRGATVSNPAPSFLPGIVVSSDDPQLGNVAPASSDERHRVPNALFARTDARDELGATLDRLGIRWVFVSELSAEITGASGLEAVGRWDDVAVYDVGSTAISSPPASPSWPRHVAQAAGIGTSVSALCIVVALFSSPALARQVATRAESAARAHSI